MDPHPLILGGTNIRTSHVLEVMNPYSGDVCSTVCMAGLKEAQEAMQYAEKGAKIMARLPAHARAAILHRLSDLMQQEAEELTSIIIQEGGKVRKYASSEVTRAIGTIRLCAEEAVRITGSMVPMDGYPAGEGRLAFSIRVPVGVVLAITPFNLPLNQICHKAGPAIAAGNACIIKPSSATPLTALKFGDLFLKAGLPKEAISVLPCSTTVAEHIVAHPGIGAFSFTGSPDIGWYLRKVSKSGKITLELGGNAAVIVHEDADLNYAATRIVEGAFSHAGQVCISVQRVFVHRNVYDTLTELIVSNSKALKTGDPANPATDIGPMIHEEKAVQAQKRITDAVLRGAKLLCGGDISGAILTPTILVDTIPDMSVNCEEIFAPVLTITPYDSFEEAVTMVNNSKYGLQAGIFTADLKRAFFAAASIECGAVVIGDIPTFRIDSMPYGGVKDSGTGREGPVYAIREMTEERLIIMKA